MNLKAVIFFSTLDHCTSQQELFFINGQFCVFPLITWTCKSQQEVMSCHCCHKTSVMCVHWSPVSHKKNCHVCPLITWTCKSQKTTVMSCLCHTHIYFVCPWSHGQWDSREVLSHKPTWTSWLDTAVQGQLKASRDTLKGMCVRNDLQPIACTQYSLIVLPL